LWPQDFKQDRLPCRLFRVQPWGVNWKGETHFNVNQRLLLKLVVLDDEKALLWNGKTVLRETGNPADFCLRLVATPETDATIHNLACRKPTTADATEAGLKLPRRVLPCDITAATERLAIQRADVPDDKPQEGRDFALADKNFLFRWIEPGELILGDAKAPYPQLGSGQEKVRITRGYWLGAYEVTQDQWECVMQSNPSRITGSPHLPVNGVTWSEACRFCGLLTMREREAGRCPDGYEYRLPTEAEWEWACRAGTDNALTIPEEERPVRERYSSLVEVGSTPANPWGLHELLGNVPEWCLDTWRDYTGETTLTVSDRLIESKGQGPFVVRGGGVWFDESAATSFARTKRHDIPGGFRGFRLALAPTPDAFGARRAASVRAAGMATLAGFARPGLPAISRSRDSGS
jgi:sulfatase modifying factor 1